MDPSGIVGLRLHPCLLCPVGKLPLDKGRTAWQSLDRTLKDMGRSDSLGGMKEAINTGGSCTRRALNDLRSGFYGGGGEEPLLGLTRGRTGGGLAVVLMTSKLLLSHSWDGSHTLMWGAWDLEKPGLTSLCHLSWKGKSKRRNCTSSRTLERSNERSFTSHKAGRVCLP